MKDVHYQHAGRVKLDALDRENDLFLASPETKYFICGPESFMTAIETQLLEFGIGQERIKMEVFGTGEITRQ